MAILYGYLFPLIFLVAFWAVYRNDPVPLALHIGQFLTITILGSACFGLPTTIVSERERGVWRRYRLLPARSWVFVASVLVARRCCWSRRRCCNWRWAFAFGMPWPAHPVGAVGRLSPWHRFAFLALGHGDRHAGGQCPGGAGAGPMHLPAHADDRRRGGAAGKPAALGAAHLGLLSRPLCGGGDAACRHRHGLGGSRL